MLFVVKAMGQFHGWHERLGLAYEQLPHVLDTVSLFLLDLYHLPLEKIVDRNTPWGAASASGSSSSTGSSSTELLEFVLFNGQFGKHFRESDVRDAFGVAFAQNNLQAVKLLCRYAPGALTSEMYADSPMDRGIEHGHLELIQWYWEFQKDKLQVLSVKNAIEVAALNGRLELLQFFLESMATTTMEPDYFLFVAALAIAKGHGQVVQYLVQTRLLAPIDWLKHFALLYVDQELVGYLDAQTPTIGGPDEEEEEVIDWSRARKLGVELMKVIDPLEMEETMTLLQEAFEYEDDAVVTKTKIPQVYLGKRVLMKASVRALDWICWRLPSFRVDHSFLVQACATGHVEMVQWIWTKTSSDPEIFGDTTQALVMPMETACAFGHLALAKCLVALGFEFTSGVCWPRILQKAVENGHMEVVQWLRSKVEELVWNTTTKMTEMIDAAAVKGHFPVVCFLDEFHNHKKYPSRALDNAAKSGNLAMLQFLLDKVYDQNLTACRTALQHAIRYGQLQVVQLLYETIQSMNKATSASLSLEKLLDALTEAAFGGFFEVVQFILSHEKVKRTHNKLNCKQLIREAVGTGHFGVVKLLHSLQVKGFSDSMMDIAAEAGYLGVVRFLHEHCQLKCSPDAMDGAAKYGFLQVVQYLHETCAADCTEDAMNSAAYYGHLPIIKFLDANRAEGCTKDAMQDAAWNGHLEVVKFLHAKGYESSLKALQNAASSGHLEMVQFLITKEFASHATIALTTACEDARFEMVEWLVESGYVDHHDMVEALQVAQEEAQAQVEDQEDDQDQLYSVNPAALRRVILFLQSRIEDQDRSTKRRRFGIPENN